MKLTSLELLGFKSFLNRTTFHFNNGVTCIVGPNGCGKSNIVDAMAWVLGERGTKSLRVKEMGDVIFHGSGSKKQVNMAEVTIGLTNSEKEYAIRRRIYRDGTNEYYINNDPVRLKDIQDFLLGTGVGLHNYAIIEQGNIEYFTQMKPHERRIVVEETSGITRFEEKKRDAFVRMEEVKASLERVEDIRKEVSKNHDKAQEEAGRLRIHNALREKLRDIDVSILVDGFARLKKREAKLREREEQFQGEIEIKESARQVVRERIAAKDEEIALIDSLSRKGELDIKDKEKDMESRLLEINYTEGEKKRLETLTSELRKEISAVTERIAGNQSQIVLFRASAEQEKQALATATEAGRGLEARREELRRVREGLERETEETRNRLFGVMTRLTEIRNSVLERERQLKEREARRLRRLEEEKAITEKLHVLEEKLTTAQERIASEREEKDRLEAEEGELTERIDCLTRELLELRSSVDRLKGLRKGKEDIFKQMKSYGDAQKKEAAPYKQLINILRSSKETEEAIERFFSKEMEYKVLTETDPTHLTIIAREYGDEFIFFPVKGMFGLKNGEAEVKMQIVEALPEAFRRIADGEEGVFLAENILVDSRGIIRKGQDKGALSIREFRERMRLEAEIAEIDEKLKEISAKLNDLQPRQRDLEKTRQVVREKKRDKEAALSSMDREAIDKAVQVRTMKERLVEIANRSEPVLEEGDNSTEAELAAETGKWENEKNRVEQSLTDLKGTLEEAKEDYSATDVEFHAASIEIERSRNRLKKNEDEALQKEAALDSFERERSVKNEKAAQAERDLAQAIDKLAGLEKSYAALQEACRTAVVRYEETKTRLGDLHMEKVSLQEELQSFDQEIEKIRVRKEALEKEKVIITEKIEAIRERLRSDYRVENIDDVEVTPVGDEAEREAILRELSALGEVNFRAEKEQVELRERLEFLEKQNTDLVQAMESLRKTIAKIDSVSRELFLETFERVNDAFKRLTHTLFKGGHGTLTLNPETNGIDMYVQPPGKKVIRMELLSGGEKALISLSFLLSLMETKASPFTLMDEIDAPLDDANLLSLLDIIKVIANRTQTILITHNRMTMESAATIYGITMEQDGVSKTISIKL